MPLRYYQTDAIKSVWDYLGREDGVPVCVLPTGSGKTAVLAHLAGKMAAAGGRCMIASHVRELVSQVASGVDKWTGMQCSVYSAGLDRREAGGQIVAAGVQSVYRCPERLGSIDLLLIDEAHLVNQEEDSMYGQLIGGLSDRNPDMRIALLTATPYRLDSGLIYGTGCLGSRLVYQAPLRRLIDEGYLCRPVCRGGTQQAPTGGARMRAGEFVAADIEASVQTVLQSAIAEIAAETRDRKSLLVFAQSVAQCQWIAEQIEAESGEKAAWLCGETPLCERDDMINEFRERGIKTLVNVGCLTTGFDAPDVDAIALLSATASPGRLYQMCGRGLRIGDKKDCVILDYGENFARLGPLDALATPPGRKAERDGEAPSKECPKCRAICHAAAISCLECDYQFPPRQNKVAPVASSAPVLTTDEIDCLGPAVLSRHAKAGKPDSLRVDWPVSIGGRISEWVCLEHSGYAKEKAHKWWRKLAGTDPPETIDDAISRHEEIRYVETLRVAYEDGSKWPRVKDYVFGEPPAVQAESAEQVGDVNVDLAWVNSIGDPFADCDLPF